MVPSSCACSVCGMISKCSVKLPCSHVVYVACHTTNSANDAGQCPLDRQPLRKVDSVSMKFPIIKIRKFKAHCWNEAQGCEFVDSMKTLLKHHELNCTFQLWNV
ncbi:hypothetical protein MRX96_049826 [Rhipicephalus microplus]